MIKPNFGRWFRTCINRDDSIGRLARIAPSRATKGGLYVLTDWIEQEFQQSGEVTPLMLELIRVAYEAYDEYDKN